MEEITGAFYYYGITEYNFISRNGCYGSCNTSIITNITWNNASISPNRTPKMKLD
jgi:hypothetical protein